MEVIQKTNCNWHGKQKQKNQSFINKSAFKFKSTDLVGAAVLSFKKPQQGSNGTQDQQFVNKFKKIKNIFIRFNNR